MDEDGRIEVSGMVDPSLLLKMLAKAGKKAEICWWQFGQCSSNLYIPEYKEYNWNGPYGGDGWCYGCSHPGGGGYGGHGYYVDDRHLHYGAFGDRPQPKIQYKPVEEPPAADAPKGGCCSLM
ncbi:hypothetical protein Acr_29g0010730 [Actinidia rufa]|uniref:Heavy metal transport/detoxification superfamily protein n=1 Tax=Actinidia rufa TaxID=165716 RepID=A0A7J0HG17_9ERIC|nr:hypothetical protein Acr_29g0010730 [Actinidia rufa]